MYKLNQMRPIILGALHLCSLTCIIKNFLVSTFLHFWQICTNTSGRSKNITGKIPSFPASFGEICN